MTNTTRTADAGAGPSETVQDVLRSIVRLGWAPAIRYHGRGMWRGEAEHPDGPGKFRLEPDPLVALREIRDEIVRQDESRAARLSAEHPFLVQLERADQAEAEKRYPELRRRRML